MDEEENQKQVSLFAHSPWKSQKARFPHSHRPDDFPCSKNQNTKTKTQRKETLPADRFAPASRLILR